MALRFDQAFDLLFPTRSAPFIERPLCAVFCLPRISFQCLLWRKPTLVYEISEAEKCPEPPFRLYFFASAFRQEQRLTVSVNMVADQELNNAVLRVFFL